MWRLSAGREADARLRQLGEPHQQMPLAPGVIRAPAGAARLAPRARVEDVAGGEVAVGHLRGRQLRGIALLAAQAAQLAEEAAAVLRVAIGRCRSQQDGANQNDDRLPMSPRRTCLLPSALY